MSSICDICAKEKETETYQLKVAFSGSEEKEEWKVCKACDSAFDVIKDYVQGQR